MRIHISSGLDGADIRKLEMSVLLLRNIAESQALIRKTLQDIGLRASHR